MSLSSSIKRRLCLDGVSSGVLGDTKDPLKVNSSAETNEIVLKKLETKLSMVV